MNWGQCICYLGLRGTGGEKMAAPTFSAYGPKWDWGAPMGRGGVNFLSNGPRDNITPRVEEKFSRV